MERVISIPLFPEQENTTSQEIEQLLDQLDIQIDKESFTAPVAIQNKVAIFRPLEEDQIDEIQQKLQQTNFKGRQLSVIILQRKMPRKRNMNAILLRCKTISLQQINDIFTQLNIKPQLLRQTSTIGTYYAKFTSEEEARQVLVQIRGYQYEGGHISVHIAH